MSNRKFDLHDGKSGAAIVVRVQPWSKHNLISDILDDGSLVIRLAVQDDDEKNTYLTQFIAEILGVSASQVEIVAKKSSTEILIAVLGLDKQTVHDRIIQKLKKQ